MTVRLFQINPQTETAKRQNPETFGGNFSVKSDGYKLVFSGKLPCENPEDVYRLFHLQPPAGYRGDPLDISDVVEMTDEKTGECTFWYCDEYTFRRVIFHPDAAKISENCLCISPSGLLSVLLIEPLSCPKPVQIHNTILAVRQLIGGEPEEYMPFTDDVALVCNAQGKTQNLPPNRTVIDDNRRTLNVILGTFFLAYAPVESNEYIDLPERLLQKYTRIFYSPNAIVHTKDCETDTFSERNQEKNV